VTRLFEIPPPADNSAPQEVTYHGVEAVGPTTILAANEGRSYVDSIDTRTGKRIDRLTDVSKPCCIEAIPGSTDSPTRVLVSNIGDATLRLVEVSADGHLKSLGDCQVGAAPKRVAFVPWQHREPSFIATMNVYLLQSHHILYSLRKDNHET